MKNIISNQQPESISPEVQRMADEVIRKLDEYERIRDLSDEVLGLTETTESEEPSEVMNGGSAPQESKLIDEQTTEPADVPSVSFLSQLEELAPVDPVYSEALRIIRNMTPEAKEEWFNAFEPDWDVPKLDQLEKQINLPEKKRTECLLAIHRALSEMPEFAVRKSEEFNPEDIEEPLPTDGAVKSTNKNREISVAKTFKFTLTKQAWESIGKKANWL